MSDTGRRRGNGPTEVTKFTQNRIKAERNKRGLTMRDVSTLATANGRSLSITAQSKLETGERRIDIEDLALYALIFDMESGDLLPRPGARAIPISSLEALIREWSELGGVTA